MAACYDFAQACVTVARSHGDGDPVVAELEPASANSVRILPSS